MHIDVDIEAITCGHNTELPIWYDTNIFYIKFGRDPSCIGFWDIVRKSHK